MVLDETLRPVLLPVDVSPRPTPTAGDRTGSRRASAVGALAAGSDPTTDGAGGGGYDADAVDRDAAATTSPGAQPGAGTQHGVIDMGVSEMVALRGEEEEQEGEGEEGLAVKGGLDEEEEEEEQEGAEADEEAVMLSGPSGHV
ncbi:hypothetical protein CRUP_006767, partial [Coryphaenoides rupestris]